MYDSLKTPGKKYKEAETRVALFCHRITENGRATFVILMHTVKGSKNGIEVPYLLRYRAHKPTKEWVGVG